VYSESKQETELLQRSVHSSGARLSR